MFGWTRNLLNARFTVCLPPEKKTRMGSKASGSLGWFDGLSWFLIGKRCSLAADGISTLIANCRFLVVLSLIEAETSCAAECRVLAALFPSTRLGCFDMSVLFSSAAFVLTRLAPLAPTSWKAPGVPAPGCVFSHLFGFL